MEDALGQQALSLAQRGLLDAIQYHGELPLRTLVTLDAYFQGGGVGRYAAIGIATEADFTLEHELYLAGEPRVLCDARSGAQTGGTGLRIDGSVLRQRTAERPLWLAGGLGPETIGDAIRRYRPELVDASSKLEASPGIKDPQRLRTFFEEVVQ
jgi:phosphoribosylanthranilate isomerase